jgi:hypothetical protein
MTQLFQEVSAGAAMEKVKAMTAGIVSFVLSRGFGVPISGKRAKLIELVLGRYTASAVSEYHALVAQRETVAEVRADQRRVASQARRIALEQRRIVARERIDAILQQDEIVLLSLYDGLRQRYDALDAVINSPFPYVDVLSLLPSHVTYSGLPFMNPRQTVQIMIEFVVKFLTFIHQSALEHTSSLHDSIRQHEINVYINSKINNVVWFKPALRSTAHSCNIHFTQAGIEHMIRMAKMYNYRRMLQTDQSYFNYAINYAMQLQQPRPIVYTQQMKVLNIRVELNELEEEREHQECGVCYDKMSARDMVLTGCNHAFCSDCIGGFARTRGIKSFINCPLCRTEIAEFSVSCQEKHVAVIAGLAPVRI